MMLCLNVQSRSLQLIQLACYRRASAGRDTSGSGCGGTVPAEQVLAIESATGGQVTCHELRPDLYPLEAGMAAIVAASAATPASDLERQQEAA